MAFRADGEALAAAAARSGLVPPHQANARTIALAVGLPVRTVQYAMRGRPMADRTWFALRGAFGDGWWSQVGAPC